MAMALPGTRTMGDTLVNQPTPTPHTYRRLTDTIVPSNYKGCQMIPKPSAMTEAK